MNKWLKKQLCKICPVSGLCSGTLPWNDMNKDGNITCVQYIKDSSCKEDTRHCIKCNKYKQCLLQVIVWSILNNSEQIISWIRKRIHNLQTK